MKSSNIYPDRCGPPLSRTLRIAYLLFVSAVCSLAIDPQRAMSQYVRDHWAADQGFPRASVYAITQTSDGYLWIGTAAGLLRFDGLHFLLMRDRSGASSPSGVIGLTPDRDGNLWLRRADMTLLRYRNGTFDIPFTNGEVNSNITAMARTTRGELLAAKMQLGAFTYRNGTLEALARATGVPRSPIIAIAQTGDGYIWLGSRGAGLIRLGDGSTLNLTSGLPDPKINCLLADGDKALWIGTDNGLSRWDGARLTSSGIPADLKTSQILALSKDHDGNLWVGTDLGDLWRFNSTGASALAHGPAESVNALMALFEDREGNLWVGSAGGLERLRDSPFVTYSVPEGLPTDGSNPLFVDSDNRTWFAPESGGLSWFRDKSRGAVSVDGLDKDVVYSITGGDNELWVARQRGGLTRLRQARHGFSAKTFRRVDGLAQNSVYSIYRTGAGVVWAGTLSGGVSKLAGGMFTTYTIADGLASNTVASILETAGGTMWFATPSGLSSLSQGHWQTFTSADGLPSPNVNCLLADSTGVLWAGTTAGLAVRNATGRFDAPARLPPSLGEQVLGLAEDKFDSLWIATASHVLRVNRGKLLRGELADGDLREFGLADGLRGVEGVKRHRSVVADTFGRIWFSLNQGISVVDPARLSSSSAPAIAQIQNISADGLTLEMKDHISVPAGRQRVVFDYAGLSLTVPDRVRFRFRLDGFDHYWSEPTASRQAVYTNLGPAAYRFRVLAGNPDGVWSPVEASLAFDVAPSYWQTWWFRTALLLLCGLLALALYRLRLRQLTARLNIRFEERLAERTRIAQELHDTLLQGFLSASLQVHAAADRLPPDSQVKPILTRALEVMRQVIDEGRNAVRGLRSARTASMDLEEAFSQIQHELSFGGGLATQPSFRVISEGQPLPLHPILRDEVYRIGREALINAFRHAGAKTIEIELNYSSSVLRMLVRDDGCGIDPRTLREGRHGHWGLSGMRERAERIGAKLRLFSAPGSGTEIELSVPAKIAYRAEARGGAKHGKIKSSEITEKAK